MAIRLEEAQRLGLIEKAKARQGSSALDTVAQHEQRLHDELVQVGAERAFELAAKWLAATAPEVHAEFLREFS